MMKIVTLVIGLFFSISGYAENFGAPLTLENPVTVEDAVAFANTDKIVLIEGEVSAVCQVKGCWMGFKSNDGDVRVTFKNYDFFVPTNIVGKTAKAEGTLKKVTLSLKDSKHLVEDGGGDPDTVTEPLVEYQMVASGVSIQ